MTGIATSTAVAPALVLTDSFGRVIDNLRISVTDRCNFRCRYCMPEEGMQWLKRSQLLSFEEIARLTRIFAALGIRKIRLTGGEPLMRKELHQLVRQLSTIPDIHDIALTTNGYFLAEQAEGLARAGLRRINVSLDSLDAETFAHITRRSHFDDIWRGIEAAEAAGLRPIKLNVVLIRGVNDDEILRFAELVRSRPFVVRFIEFMPIGLDDGWSPEKVVASREVIAKIEEAIGVRLVPIESYGSASANPDDSRRSPAHRYLFEDGVGEIGFISSVSEPFCEQCNRVRLTSDGKLRTCLFSLHETDLRALLRGGAVDDEIAGVIAMAVRHKEPGHLINRPEFTRPERTMSQIGG